VPSVKMVTLCGMVHGEKTGLRMAVYDIGLMELTTGLTPTKWMVKRRR